VSDYNRFATNSSSSVALSGSFTGGSREIPKVVLVNGDLNVGNVTIDGYVALLVPGDIEINGNARVGTSGFSASDESSIAFYAGGDIDMTVIRESGLSCTVRETLTWVAVLTSMAP
jgi:hypothetical protein